MVDDVHKKRKKSKPRVWVPSQTKAAKKSRSARAKKASAAANKNKKDGK